MPIPALVGAALVSSGGSLLSSLLGSASSRSNAELQYKHNLALQQDAQRYNTAERQAAQQFQLDMFNKANAYNDPSSQVRRLRAAGINPLSGQMAASTAQAVGSSPQGSVGANSVSQAPPTNYSFVQDAMAAAQMQRAFESADVQDRKGNAEAEGEEIDNLTRMQMNELALYREKAEIHALDIDTKYKQKLDEEVDQKILNWRAMTDKAYAEANAATVNSHVNVANAHANEARVQIEQFNAITNRMNATTAQIEANIHAALAASNIQVNAAEVREVSERIHEIQERCNKLPAEKRQAEAIAAMNEFEVEWNKEHPYAYWTRQVFGSGSSIVAAGAGAYVGVKGTIPKSSSVRSERKTLRKLLRK